jgi:hypothetical protein
MLALITQLTLWTCQSRYWQERSVHFHRVSRADTANMSASPLNLDLFCGVTENMIKSLVTFQKKETTWNVYAAVYFIVSLDGECY